MNEYNLQAQSIFKLFCSFVHKRLPIDLYLKVRNNRLLGIPGVFMYVCATHDE